MLPRHLLYTENCFIFYKTLYKGNPKYDKAINQFVIKYFLELILPACLEEADYKTCKEIQLKQYISSAFKHADVKDFSSKERIYIQLIRNHLLWACYYVKEEEIRSLQSDLDHVHASVSFRIGRAITWLPRKLYGGVKCVRDHGVGYTLRRALYHLGLWEDEEAPKGPENRPRLGLRAERLLKGKRG